MKMFTTFVRNMAANDTETAAVVEKRDSCSTHREEFNGYDVRALSGATVELLLGYYRTPIVKYGEVVWSDDQRMEPLLSQGDCVVFQETPSGSLIWCPLYEWDEALNALLLEQRDERDLKTSASQPDLRIVHDNERHKDNPVVVWSGWLRKDELHTFSGVLPRGYDGHIVECYNSEDDYWESVYNPEATFGQLVNAKHAKKRVSV